jgi:hypothetical protein
MLGKRSLHELYLSLVSQRRQEQPFFDLEVVDDVPVEPREYLCPNTVDLGIISRRSPSRAAGEHQCVVVIRR